MYTGWEEANFAPDDVTVADEPAKSSYWPERLTFSFVMAGGDMVRVQQTALVRCELEMDTNLGSYDPNTFRARGSIALGASSSSVIVLTLHQDTNTVRWRAAPSAPFVSRGGYAPPWTHTLSPRSAR